MATAAVLPRVEVQPNSDPRTHDGRCQIALCALLEQGSDATFLRKVIVFAAKHLMTLEAKTLCTTAPGERSTERTNQRTGYRERNPQTPAGTVELRIPSRRR